MKFPYKSSARIACAFGVIGVCAALAANWMDTRGEVAWERDFQAAEREASASKKLILLDFSASWCGPCKRMRIDTLSDPQVANAIKDYIPVSIDVDDNPDLAREYGVEAIPAFVIVTSTGAHAGKEDLIGYSTPSEFIAWLSSKPPR